MHGGNRFSLSDDLMKDTSEHSHIYQLLNFGTFGRCRSDLYKYVAICMQLVYLTPSHLPLHLTHSCALMF